MRRREVLLSLAAAASLTVRPGVLRAQAAVDRIGLLLPKSAGPFGRASTAVRSGIEAAWKREGRGFAVDIYEIDETATTLAAAYRGMLERGTALVLGPLTRAGASSLLQLGDVPITTITLNQIEGEAALPWNVIVFTLAVELEASQIAQEAFRVAQAAAAQSVPRATIVTADSSIGRRAAASFLDSWRALGGEAGLPLELELGGLYKFRTLVKNETGDVVFLSMDSNLARPVCTIMGNARPIFGTSLLSVGGPSATPVPELNGVRLLEMPAILDPGYAGRIGQDPVPADFSLEMQRLYCLGVDAMRVARAMFTNTGRFAIDGLSGRLRYDADQPRIERSPVLAAYRDGVPVPL